MSAEGEVFEYDVRGIVDRPCLHLRIPLPSGQYINFVQDLDSQGQLVPLSKFVQVVQNAFIARQSRQQITHPPASEAAGVARA
jgi:hypothetical protein